MQSISPSDVDLKDSLRSLRAENTSLGVAKLHALLLASHPGWTVSEKRVRKVLQAENLLVAPPLSKADIVPPGKVFPSSRLLDGLDVKQWTPKVRVKYFGKAKGKGLVATENIAEGEQVWKEDPFIIAPEWDIYDLQKSSAACAFCTTPLTSSSLVTNCTAPSSTTQCTARFCNRLCLSRSSRIHPLLCPSHNPASVPLLTFTRKTEWMALHAVAHCTARILLSNEVDQDARDEDWRFLQSLAELGMEERFKNTGANAVEPDRETWKKAHTLILQAFCEPSSPLEQKKLSRIIKTLLPDHIAAELFSYDAFLHNLGRMSLNLEAHGGLYTLHSHINHACTPNISVRHFDTRTALARITLVAKRDISEGEELVITYVNPELPLKARRWELSAWGFGTCYCGRCKEEEAASTDENGTSTSFDPDLENELRAGLGVM